MPEINSARIARVVRLLNEMPRGSVILAQRSRGGAVAVFQKSRTRALKWCSASPGAVLCESGDIAVTYDKIRVVHRETPGLGFIHDELGREA